MHKCTYKSVGQCLPALPWHMEAHSHGFCELIVPMRGTQRVIFTNETVTASPGDVLFYGENVLHEERADARQVFETFFITFTWDDCPSDLPRLIRDRQGRIRFLTEWLMVERQSSSANSPDISQSLLQALLGHLVSLCRDPADDLIQKARQYVQRNVARSISLDELAEAAETSKYHFIRKYRALSGRTPMEDVRHMRVERARELILTTNLPLKAIPEQVGLENAYHMSRLFRQCLGITPGSLRRKAR